MVLYFAETSDRSKFACNFSSSFFFFFHGEPQALATEIWGKICPPSDQEAIV